MSKKNWRDSGAGPERTRSKSSDHSGWSKSAASKSAGSGKGLGWFGKTISLLLSAALLGALLAFYWYVIRPEPVTPLVFFESFPESQGDHLLSSNAFADSTKQTLEKNTSDDITFHEGNLQRLADVDVQASGPAADNNVVLFYVYSDIFINEANEPCLFTEQNALQESANLRLHDFLQAICTKDIGEEPSGGNHRLVILDGGRLDPTSFSTVPPAAIAESVRMVVNSLVEAKVPNSQRLWVMLAADDYQLGWTSPELNGSVFGYFFSRGLMGEADQQPADEIITLAELTTYVRQSVAQWVENYRDAVQTPVLICGGQAAFSQDIQLLYHHGKTPQAVEGFTNSKILHNRLWQEAYQIPQPHRRQMACSRLARLEQLRYCSSQEYDLLVNSVKSLIGESTANLEFDERPTSVFNSLDEEDLDELLTDEFVGYLKQYLTPRPPAAKGDSAAGDSAGQDGDGQVSGSGAPSPDAEVADNQDEPVDPQAPGVWENQLEPKLKRRPPLQHLALAWHTLVHHLPLNGVSAAHPFGKKQLGQLIRLAQTDDRQCEALIEFQYLQLLYDSLPWSKNDFDISVVFDSIRCLDSSQSLLHGSLASYSDPDVQAVPAAVWLNWRHLEREFVDLEKRRRFALDHAIAGDFAGASIEFKQLLKDYQAASSKMDGFVRARKTANDLLFVLPYLKSFALREAVYRRDERSIEKNRGDEAKDEIEPIGSANFCLPLNDLRKLEQNANDMIRLLSGSTMYTEDIDDLKTMHSETLQIVSSVQDRIKKIASESAQTQSASKYVFEALGLLSTPIPEWVDDSTATAAQSSTPIREGILGRLDVLLKSQQQQFFKTGDTDQQPIEIDPERIAARHRELARAKIKLYDDVQDQLRPVDSLLGGLEKNRSWIDVQQTVPKLGGIEGLKNQNPQAGLAELTDSVSLNNEILRLDKVDRQIRHSGLAIGLAKQDSISDIQHQLTLLNRFDFHRRMLIRSIRDFWGGGDVGENLNKTPPFMRRVEAEAENLKLLAESAAGFRLNGKPHPAYDTDSLAAHGRDLKSFADQIWIEFSRLQSFWEHNRTQMPPQRNELRLPEDATSNRLSLGLAQLESTLTDSEYFPTEDESNKLTVARQIGLDQRSYFGSLQIPEDIRKTTRAKGTITFRGHSFASDLTITKLTRVVLPTRTVRFEPQFQSNDKALITVNNIVENEVDIIFLLDCSQSMEGDRIVKLKSATRAIMNELVTEPRFHIGLAAFGHRGKFTNERRGNILATDENKKYPVHGVHPFEDWSMLKQIPDLISDERYVKDLCDFELDVLKTRGLTPLYYSMLQTLPKFTNFARKNFLIVVTDGRDSQVPANLPTVAAAIPVDETGRDKRPTTLADLNSAFQRKYRGKVEVLVIQIDPSQMSNMPEGVLTYPLQTDIHTEMKQQILNLVGRYRFSVAKPGSRDIHDKRPMGQTITVTEITPDTDYEINTDPAADPVTLKLNGGEKYTFEFTANGLKFVTAESKLVADNFIRPKIDPPVELYGEDYKVGLRRTDLMDMVRIGFANKRGLSRYPSRVWARVSDNEGREFDMTRPTKEFSTIPTYNFQMPDNLAAKSVDMTVYVQASPGGDVVLPADSIDDPGFIEIQGEKSGQFRRLNFDIKQSDDSQTRFIVTIHSDPSIDRAFHLDCPNSIAIDDRTLVIRSATFKDASRAEETFEFEIPQDQPPIFRLYALPADQFEAAIKNRPESQSVRQVVDPIFGDPCIAIQFDGIPLRR